MIMEDLNRLVRLLNSTQDMVDKILRKTIPICSDLHSANSKTLQLFIAVKPMPPKDALAILNKAVNSVMADPRALQQQLDIFAQYILDSTPVTEMVGCPYMQEVWSGDMYGEAKINGIVALYNELVNQYKSISNQLVVDIAIKNEF
jgi:hypothetical protein